MAFARSDLVDFNCFLAVAEHRNLRLAGLDLGVSASAVSHALKDIENRLGVRLFNRTNRSVTLTAAGEELRADLLGPFAAISQAVEKLNVYRDSPSGRVRLNVVSGAVEFLIAPVLPEFVKRYPDIELDIVVSDKLVDIVGEGFDAGIRFGGTIPKDMIAQRLSSDLRWVVAASPSYIEEFGRPERPEDLRDHRCIGVKLGDGSVYRWEFMGADGEYDIAIPASISINGGPAMFALGLSGVGLMYVAEETIGEHLARGELEVVLDRWATAGPGFQIYYSSRRQLPTGLRLLIDLIREMKPLGI